MGSKENKKDKKIQSLLSSWNPAKAIRHPDWIQSSNYLSQLFIPSYDTPTEHPDMFHLLSFEYGRRWVKERDFFESVRVKKIEEETHKIPKKNLTRPGYIQLRNVALSIIKRREAQIAKEQAAIQTKKRVKRPKPKPISESPKSERAEEKETTTMKKSSSQSQKSESEKPESEYEKKSPTTESRKSPKEEKKEDIVEKCPCGCFHEEECPGPPHPNLDL